MAPFNSLRTKTQLKLALTRCQLLIQKKNALAKQSRRQIANFLEAGKLETAEIRTESIINDDIHVELLEILELYCEILVARWGIVENSRDCDASVAEPICGIIHAAPKTELRELHALRELLMSKYGRDFSIAVMDNKDNCVPDRVVSKITSPSPPPKSLVEAYMYEIARSYGINYVPEGIKKKQEEEARLKKELEGGDGGGGTEGVGEKGKGESLEGVDMGEVKKMRGAEEVGNGTNGGDEEKPPTYEPNDMKSMNTKSNNNTRLGNLGGVSIGKSGGGAIGSGGDGDDYDDLMKRFEALKRK